MSTFLGVWFLFANAAIIVLTSVILAGGLVPRRMVRRLRGQIATQARTIEALEDQLLRSERINAAIARGWFKPATPSPTTRLPGPQDAPAGEWTRHGGS